MALMNRKTFFTLVSAAVLAALGIKSFFKKNVFQLNALKSNAANGHKIRDKKTLKPNRPDESKIQISTQVIIVGGGISGLIAAKELKANQIPFLLLELENESGGNAISGENKVSAFPWGAHYLPVPNLNQPKLIKFLEEIEVITGYNEQHLPIYDEFALCAEPEERLFIHKYWQEGLIPEFGLNAKDHEDIQAFFSLINNYKNAIGSDKKEAFCIPIAHCSQDPIYLQLDQITFLEFLKKHQLKSKYLHWYLNYCCNDDFGTSLEKTSAWAGIHYFAARKGIAANAKADDVLTWPEGNNYLVKKIKHNISNHIQTNSLVCHVEEIKPGIIWVNYQNTESGASQDLFCHQVIMATPQFINKRIVQSYPKLETNFEYNPWLIANITTRPLLNSKGLEMCWDNVLFNSPSLGYINACHQSLNSRHQQYVLTYYLPLCQKTAKEERKVAYEKTNEEWAELVLSDLEKAHPDIRDKVDEISLKLWGHAMISPMPHVIWNAEKEKLLQHPKNIVYAHTDLSGMSIFEEAFYQGVQAANTIIASNTNE